MSVSWRPAHHKAQHQWHLQCRWLAEHHQQPAAWCLERVGDSHSGQWDIIPRRHWKGQAGISLKQAIILLRCVLCGATTHAARSQTTAKTHTLLRRITLSRLTPSNLALPKPTPIAKSAAHRKHPSSLEPHLVRRFVPHRLGQCQRPPTHTPTYRAPLRAAAPASAAAAPSASTSAEALAAAHSVSAVSRGTSSSYMVHTRAVWLVRLSTRGSAPARRWPATCVGWQVLAARGATVWRGMAQHSTLRVSRVGMPHASAGRRRVLWHARSRCERREHQRWEQLMITLTVMYTWQGQRGMLAYTQAIHKWGCRCSRHCAGTAPTHNHVHIAWRRAPVAAFWPRPCPHL